MSIETVSETAAEIDTMTDREIAEETLHILRSFYTILEQLGNNPMARTMLRGMMG